jgi:hypothetical protein
MSEPTGGSAPDEPLRSQPAITSPTRAYPTLDGPPPLPSRRGRTGLLVAAAVTLVVIAAALTIAVL